MENLPLILIGLYFLVLISISFFTGKEDSNDAFFLGNKKSPWYIVSFGMIGASLSGVTFISVPGWVANTQFSYLQMCLGYVAGYFVVSFVLLPIYYRMNLTSIYSYLGERFGKQAHLTGSFFFILSRVIGASFRLYLVANIFQMFIADAYGIAFYETVIITIVLIWLYTFRSGIKTIIWTDTLQTLFMLMAVGVSIYLLLDKTGWTLLDSYQQMKDANMGTIFFFEDWKSSSHFVKQFISGVFITIAMTGLDQDMMQKNLSCKTLKESQTNMVSFSLVLVLVNFVFLFFGGLLYLYAQQNGITAIGDKLFPEVVMSGSLGAVVVGCFVLGLIASAYSSADSALTSLTTIFYVDFVNKKDTDKKEKLKRKLIHVAFSILLFIIIMQYKYIENDNLIENLFKAATYTYGPLLGLFFFGILTKHNIRTKWVPFVCVLSPIICFFLSQILLSEFGFDLGFTLLPVNGIISFIGLYLLKKSKS
ncbi:MAG: sodium:solute symporter [Flavobacteriales bacterium]